jgi:hypothetical protein
MRLPNDFGKLLPQRPSPQLLAGRDAGIRPLAGRQANGKPGPLRVIQTEVSTFRKLLQSHLEPEEPRFIVLAPFSQGQQGQDNYSTGPQLDDFVDTH